MHSPERRCTSKWTLHTHSYGRETCGLGHHWSHCRETSSLRLHIHWKTSVLNGHRWYRRWEGLKLMLRQRAALRSCGHEAVEASGSWNKRLQKTLIGKNRCEGPTGTDRTSRWRKRCCLNLKLTHRDGRRPHSKTIPESDRGRGDDGYPVERRRLRTHRWTLRAQISKAG